MLAWHYPNLPPGFITVHCFSDPNFQIFALSDIAVSNMVAYNILKYQLAEGCK
jgi:hypothetical protein